MSAPDPPVRLDREVVELLADRPDLLAVADAVDSTQGRRDRSGGGTPWRLLAVAAAAVLLAVVLAVVAPWRGHGGGVVERALAAVGEKPVLHAVIESVQPQTTIADLATAKEVPATQRLEYWFDERRDLLRVSARLTGTPALDVLTHPEADHSPGVNPALEQFATGYRDALASGAARETGRGSLDGRPVIWLDLSFKGSTERVAIDAATYRPVQFGPPPSNGRPGAPVWHVRSIETTERRAADFSVPANRSGGAHVTPQAAIPAERAASVLGWTPVWLGRSFGGLPLVSTQPEKLGDVTVRTPLDTGLLLSYGRAANRVMIEEAPHPGLVNGFVPDELLPEAGTAVVVRTTSSGGFIREQCRAKLRAGGLWVTVMSWNNDACVAAARALVPIGSPLVNRPTAPIRSVAPAPPVFGASPAVAPPPTPAACANAWNEHASPKALATVVRGHPRSALVRAVSSSSVSHTVVTWGPGAPAGTQAATKQGAGCSIDFFLAGGRRTFVTGVQLLGRWAWFGPLGPFTSGRPNPAGNASVSADGAVHLHP